MAVPAQPATGPTTQLEPAAPRSEWPAADGTPLHIRRWLPSGEPWARVLLVHGIGEHSGRYERAGRLMAEAGLAVEAFDLRGHGLSGGRRVYVRDWDDFLDDVEIRLAALRGLGGSVVLFGHSMGALISLTYACSPRPAPDLLVLSAPPLSASVPGWQRLLAPVLGRVAPTVVLANPISGDQLSRDPAVGIEYFGDPLVQPRTTARLGYQLFEAMKRTRVQLESLHVPTLVIHGGDDSLVPTIFSEPLGGLHGVERRVLPGLRHETLNEPEGPEVVAGIVEWLRAGVAALPAASAAPVPALPKAP
jgi:alpha-beta hydrolase superfamily lysophospholipase